MVREWMRREYPALRARLGSGAIGTWGKMVDCMAAGCVAREEAEEVRTFWEASPVIGQVSKLLKQVVEDIHLRAAFIETMVQTGVAEAGFWDGFVSKI